MKPPAERSVKRGRVEEGRRLLCDMVALRFGGTAADAIRPLLGTMQDKAQFTAVGALIIDSTTRAEMLDGTRRLAKPNDQRI